MRSRHRIVCSFVGIAGIVVVAFFFFSQIANIKQSGHEETSVFATNLSHDEIKRLWVVVPKGKETNSIFDSEDLLPIAFHNSSDSKWTLSKEEIVNDPYLLRNHIDNVNQAQYIRNTDLFGDETPLFIFIIQVHRRFTHLLYLVESLRNVRGIEKSLLVFSHDFFSPEINRMIDAIRFVRFTQIFFPYSRQVFPTSFPGTDPRDCQTRGQNHQDARCFPCRKKCFLSFFRAQNCLNRDWPDIAGNYRNAKFAQVKHHWFWKLCFVVNKMKISKAFKGHYILLEEDYVVLADLLHVLNLTKQLSSNYDLISLGSYEKQQSYNSPETVRETNWISSIHNMGMAFRKNLFEKLKPCWKSFCIYDDYNWDWSLAYIDRVCVSEKMRVLHFKSCGRVFHVGLCGLHAKSKLCNNVSASIMEVMQRTGEIGRGSSFPSELRVESGSPRHLVVQPNGGWGDVRDHALCLAILADQWLPLSQLLTSDSLNRPLDIFEPLIPGISDTADSVL